MRLGMRHSLVPNLSLIPMNKVGVQSQKNSMVPPNENDYVILNSSLVPMPPSFLFFGLCSVFHCSSAFVYNANGRKLVVRTFCFLDGTDWFRFFQYMDKPWNHTENNLQIRMVL